jgi:hypothetical protein
MGRTTDPWRASQARRRDRRGRTGIVKGRSVRSAGNVLTTLSCSASGIFAICCDLTRPTITRLARTYQSTRTRRRREQYMPLVAFCLRHFVADFIICMCEFDFRQAQVPHINIRSLRLQPGKLAIGETKRLLQHCPRIGDIARREAQLSHLEHVRGETIGVNLAIHVGPKAIHLIALDTFDGHQWSS